jgi:ParB-like chromosome segregation protein Spo0J
MSDDESFLTRLIENLHRNIEINPLAEASGYITLIDNGWTVNKIAERIGKSDSYVSDRIGLIRRLHPEIAKKFNGNDNKYLKPISKH